MGDLSGGNKSTVMGVAVMCVSVRVVRRAERVTYLYLQWTESLPEAQRWSFHDLASLA